MSARPMSYAARSLSTNSAEPETSRASAVRLADWTTSSRLSTPTTFTSAYPSASERNCRRASVRYALTHPQSTTVNVPSHFSGTVSATTFRNSFTWSYLPRMDARTAPEASAIPVAFSK